jgi:hypothetical protein
MDLGLNTPFPRRKRVRIKGIDNLKARVIGHFNNYPLQSYKANNYKIWVEMVDTLYLCPHWTKEREQKLLSLSNILNKDTPLSSSNMED